ncbi:uncharacterized protein CCOS01_11047 [Colletotrichum costaricense]|uniref:Uncharacterized protein n=1 Tax=Colletotrichum costaricense TaxID=1209916 RepID=A0AAI9YPZ4_9PEZI|nr:uncharacterized protein CCOS01_11047 [Colletotrichum costaricense]KAK1519396.1 hypothetical protein CCOS01_11047 [Colletotrichum costaricense]
MIQTVHRPKVAQIGWKTLYVKDIVGIDLWEEPCVIASDVGSFSVLKASSCVHDPGDRAGQEASLFHPRTHPINYFANRAALFPAASHTKNFDKSLSITFRLGPITEVEDASERSSSDQQAAKAGTGR